MAEAAQAPQQQFAIQRIYLMSLLKRQAHQ